jgi:hypothetical protein
MKISTILDHIDNGHMALPEFQRGYVWNRDKKNNPFRNSRIHVHRPPLHRFQPLRWSQNSAAVSRVDSPDCPDG